MPAVYPFAAVQYKDDTGDLSALVAPPYDVLDEAGKQRLISKNASNIVRIDLPHTPAKELGPASAYQAAAAGYQSLLSSGVLTARSTPAMFAYRQTFQTGGKPVKRTGMCCCVDVVPFGPREGGGVLPHEETFSGPKEDRMALMRATGVQLSPIFGLHADAQGTATKLLAQLTSTKRPDITASTDDGTLHEVWTIDHPAAINAYRDALAGEDIFIADGHHRYTTGLNYLREQEAAGTATDATRRCMMVLIGMNDPGLVIWPTHRVLGGMSGYSLDAFVAATHGILSLLPFAGKVEDLESELLNVTSPGPNRQQNVIGLYDFATGRCFTASFAKKDPLRDRFADKPQAWRDLDVALIQYIVVEQVCQAKLNGGNPVKWAFPHTTAEVLSIGRGEETGAGGGKNFAQIAVIVKPTPLSSVQSVSRANQLMPQKSTFFYPKLATGLFMNPLK